MTRKTNKTNGADEETRTLDLLITNQHSAISIYGLLTSILLNINDLLRYVPTSPYIESVHSEIERFKNTANDSHKIPTISELPHLIELDSLLFCKAVQCKLYKGCPVEPGLLHKLLDQACVYCTQLDVKIALFWHEEIVAANPWLFGVLPVVTLWSCHGQIVLDMRPCQFMESSRRVLPTDYYQPGSPLHLYLVSIEPWISYAFLRHPHIGLEKAHAIRVCSYRSRSCPGFVHGDPQSVAGGRYNIQPYSHLPEISLPRSASAVEQAASCRG